MSDIAIRCENLGKRYRRGSRAPYHRFTDLLTGMAAAPYRAARRAMARKPKDDGQAAGGHDDGWFWALKDIDLEVKQGEVLGIIGRNGAGKSTLLKVLSRITEPTAGQATIHGRIGSLLEVGTGFHPELTGRENIYLNGAILGMTRPEIRSKFDEIVAFAEVEQSLDTPVKHYSSGMYMRLAFAVAAHLEPEILIVDEVLAVGDAEFQKKCLGKMGEVASSGRTVLFVSHQLAAIESLCRKVVLLSKGEMATCSENIPEVIREYMRGGGTDGEPAVWEGDGALRNSWFTPAKFMVADESGEPIRMPTSKWVPMWIRIEGELHKIEPALNMGYAIYAENGALLYWSLTTDSHPDDWPPLSSGQVVLQSRLPSEIFNHGSYRIELFCSLHYREWLVQPEVNAPGITLRIEGKLSESPYWMVRRPGLLGPLVAWERC